MVSWNSEAGIFEEIMAVIIRIMRCRRPRSPWVVDFFDPRTGCRHEIFYATRVEAEACRAAVLGEGDRS